MAFIYSGKSGIINNLIQNTAEQTLFFVECGIIANFTYSVALKELLNWKYYYESYGDRYLITPSFSGFFWGFFWDI